MFFFPLGIVPFHASLGLENISLFVQVIIFRGGQEIEENCAAQSRASETAERCSRLSFAFAAAIGCSEPRLGARLLFSSLLLS